MSNKGTIRASVLAKIPTLSGLTTTPLKSRKRLFFSKQHGDTFPCLVVAFDNERIAKVVQNGVVWINYDCYVMYVAGEGGALEDATAIAAIDDTREVLRVGLWKSRLSGADTVFDCDYDPNPAYDLAGLDRLYDVSVQKFTFRSSEPR